jgi:diguanylate cyclase (GGDEF)-like protein/PAS domain S-box-containing protein
MPSPVQEHALPAILSRGASERASAASLAEPQGDRRLLRGIVWLVACVWTLILAASVYYNVRLLHENAHAMAHRKAVDHFSKEFAFRLWGVGKGGLYLEVKPGTRPLDYLHFLPDRDIVTASGKTLTLYDPVSALRQIVEENRELYGVAGRIVGEYPFNPANLPDAWELRAIRAFQRGEREVHEVADLNGRPHVRIMRPMVMREACLKCHGHQGYQVGRVNAAIGVALPLDEFTVPADNAARASAVSHGAIWLLGLTGIGLAQRRVRRHLDDRLRHMEETELSARVFDGGLQAILITDVTGCILRVNPMFCELTGYTPEEAIGRRPAILKSDHHDHAFYASLWHDLLHKGRWAGQIHNRRKNGELFVVWETISAVHDEAGQTRYYIGMFQDITDQVRSHAQIRELAHYDPLTRLPNRQLFADRVSHALQRAIREARLLAVLFVDLDQFKKINDTLGHSSGDHLLVTVSERLADCVRASDTVSRLGGDEFAILLEDVDDPLDAERVAEKILRAMSDPVLLNERDWFISASVGISIFPKDGTSMESLIRSADTAMYRAKAGGRNQFRFFDEEMSEQAARHLALETALRYAVERREFLVHYQPQVDVASGAIVGVEALLRWRHDDRLVPPLDFIPLAEETGLIVPIGRCVLETACGEIARLSRDTGQRLRLAVNISARELTQPDFPGQVRSALEASGLPADQLELEITESVAMAEVEQTIAIFHALAELGVALAIDDFGTGYSSLSYLKRLPVDRLKIDRSFVEDTPEDKEDCAIVRTILGMAHTLGLQVIAEGVETEAQLDFLRREGCELAQGYHLSRPIPLDELERLLTGSR